MTKKFSSAVFILCLILLVLAGFTRYFLICLIITLPYIVLFIAHYPIPKLNKLGRFGDISYGLYIFAWPMQQTILVFFKDLQIGVYILCSFLLTIPIAYISWHFVESKALSHKKDVQDLRSLKEKLRQLVKIK
jgi:peptidoglycan/LPS O-acetylase OafA/YrhL